MYKYKVSVIIPVYNVEKYLEVCLQSIVDQTLKDIEIICVNDGSIDNSLDILEKFAQKDERIKVINKENGGYASAINTGLSLADGEFVQIVESDDYCDLSMCEDLYNKISGTDADLVTADFYFLQNNKTKVCKYLKDADKDVEYFNLVSHPYIIAKQAYPWKSLYRNSFLTKNNIKMPEDGKGAYEDQPWNALILALADKILYLNKPFYYYRLDATGSSTNCGSRKMVNYIGRKAQTFDILNKYNRNSQEVKEYFADSAVGGCLFFFKRIGFEFKEEFYNKMKAFLKVVVDDTITLKYFSNKNRKRFNKIMQKDFKSFYRFEIFKYRILKLFK